MNPYRLVAVALLVAAAVLIASAVAAGQMHVGFILIVPVIYGSGVAGAVAAILVFLAFILFAISPAWEMRREGRGQYVQPEAPKPEERAQAEGRRRFGGVVFIGPVPVIFGSDRKMTAYMVIAAIIILVLLIIAFLAGIL